MIQGCLACAKPEVQDGGKKGRGGERRKEGGKETEAGKEKNRQSTLLREKRNFNE